jgi:hypothetical protein
MKAKIKTWKMGPQRYLHCLEVPGGWFHVVTDSDYFSMNSWTILRNKVLAHNSTKETRGLKLVRERVEDLGDKEWAKLCFWGNDNLELRKKIYGKELRKIKIVVSVYLRSGRVDMIKEVGGKDLIPGRSVLLRRNLRKRIKDPLPYIILQQRPADWGEKPVEQVYSVSELSFIQFNQKLKMWYGYD